MVDAHANLVDTVVTVAPSPATSGTSLSITAGTGAWMPTAPFNVTVGPSNAVFSRSNSEILRVTSRSTDTLTVTRAQEGTTARSIAIGDRLVLGPTAKSLTDIEGDVSTLSGTVSTLGTTVTGLGTSKQDTIPVYASVGEVQAAITAGDIVEGDLFILQEV